MADPIQETLIFTIVLLLSMIATLFALSRKLPTQNVIFCAAMIALLSGVLEAMGTKTGIPYGPFFYTENLGPLGLHLLPWPVPLIWVVVILNSRGVARLILRPWREFTHYGRWSLALTCALVVLFDLVLEPFAASANHFWIWQTPRKVAAWYGASWINFAGLAATTLLILALVTPWLINKKPAGKSPPDYSPLAIWLFLVLLLTAANASHHYYMAASTGLAATITILILAWRNSRW